MTDTVNLANANPGAGKVQAFIDWSKGSNSNTVLATSTKSLADDVMERLQEDSECRHIDFKVINGNYIRFLCMTLESVIQRLFVDAFHDA